VRDDGGPAMRAYSLLVIGALLVVLAGGFGWSHHQRPVPELVTDDAPQRPQATLPGLATQALTDLRALTRPDGAVLAGPHGPWRYVWPRDASFAAAAYCASGDVTTGLRVLGFLSRVRPHAGRWAARYEADGSGPVADRRAAQLDGSGWVPWATGLCAASGASYTELRELWPMVRQSADQAVSELRGDGLPAAAPDYWERDETRPTLGTAAPLLAGLRAAAAIADRLDQQDRLGGHEQSGPSGHTADAARWQAAAERLQRAVDAELGPLGYPRDRRGGADSIVTALGPPFAPSRPDVTAAIRRSHELLTLPNGGVTPGQDWRADGIAWTPSTALFGLSAAAHGDRPTAEAVLRFLDDHRTVTGAVPEKVTAARHPAGEAPLTWTAALIVLTTTALDSALPAPPS
jgi:hypothetical protein